jgi:hypothetical protein
MNLFRFTLSHSSGSQVIDEPLGWSSISLILERSPEYHSLIELFEAPIQFYGPNDDKDGGRDFILAVEEDYGVGEVIGLLVEISSDNGTTYEELFSGTLDLSTLKEVDSQKIECGIIRNDFWAKFKNREETPVDIQSTTDLSGGIVNQTGNITLQLTPQLIEQVFDGDYNLGYFVPDIDSDGFADDYLPFDVPDIDLDEAPRKYNLPVLPNPEVPAWIFEPEFAGSYEFDIRVELSRIDVLLGGWADMFDVSDYYNKFYFQKNSDAPILFTITDHTGSTSYAYNDTHDLVPGDIIRVYTFFDTPLGIAEGLYIWGNYNNGVSETPGGTEYDLGVAGIAPSGSTRPSYLTITGQTSYPETECESFLIHDVAAAIIERITDGLDNHFYSEYLGSQDTLKRQYDADGCASNYALQKGLHLRGYTLEEKKFFQSFKEWWNGANPIFNLGLTYEGLNGVEVVRVENKSYFYDTTASLNLDYVNNIIRSYDKGMIYKKITVGYQKWQSEDIKGIDDPQTKSIWATLFETIGTEVSQISNFIAASLAVEVTRRKGVEKSADYKFDDDTFIIALNPAELASPANTYTPELDENFTSINNLTNSETRYNLFLTPLRNFLRWANHFNGCLQKYLSSSYKFVSGEGNYDFESYYSAVGDKADCEGTLFDGLTEGQDISLTAYGTDLGYLHTPVMYEFDHPLSWEDYKTIRDNRTKAIGVSTSNENHEICFIKRLEYDVNKSKAKFVVWKR